MKRLPERIREILSKRRVRRFLTRVVSIVGALVVFATTYALVLPAITMEKQAACGIEEHQHDDSCFELQLICGEEESETHQHTDECYERVLVCEKPVHTHSTECYETFEETYEEPADTDAGTEEDTMSGQTAGTDSSETENGTEENGTEAAAADGIRDTDSTGASDENTDRDETGSEKADAKDIDPGRSGSTEDSDDSDKEFTENYKSSSSKVQADAVNPGDGTIEGESLDAAEVAVTEDKTYAGLQTTLDLAGVLSDRTGLYYYPAKYDEDGIADTTAIRSDSVTDWEKVKDDTQIASADFVRVYLAYTIPAGTLNKDHYTARYRLPGALRLTENRVEAINKSKNGISKEMEASTEITRSSTDADFEEDFPTDEETWLGAEAIEGTRTPDRILDKAETEYISATVKVENIYKSGEYRGQDLIFTFTPHTVRKNQTTYNADGKTLAEGEKVRGFFTLDFNPDQISCDESGTAEILFAKESDVNDVASGQFAQKEIRRVLHLKDSQNSISGNGAIGEDATDTAVEAVNTDNTEQDRTEKKQTGKGNQTEENKDGTDAVTADQKDGLAAAEEKFLTGSVIAASGEAYEINVTYGEDAQIPDGSELRVREILENDSEYKDYSEQAVEKVEEVAAQAAEESADIGDNAAAKADSSTGNADGNNPDGQALPRKSNGYVRVFDIEIRYNGQKIEPEAEVLVEIRLLDAPENKETSLDVVHFAEDGPEVLSTDQNTNTQDTADTSIQFTTDAFSVYTIVGTETITKTILTADGKTYEITVDISNVTNIPDDAGLDIRELTEAEISQYMSDVAKALGVDADTISKAKLFDISIKKGGKEIQPNGKVGVEIKLKEDTFENAQVVHFGEETEVLNATTEGDSVSFETGSFSVYAVIDGSNDENARVPVEFYNGDTKIATMYIKNGDVLLGDGERQPNVSYLEDIIVDPGVGTIEDDELFRGWSTDPGYTVADAGSAMTIEGVREYLADNVIGSITEGDEAIKIYAMIYKYFDVTYFGLDEGISLGSDTVLRLRDEEQANYQVSMPFTAESNAKFMGWKAIDGTYTNIVGATNPETVYPNTTIITITDDVIFKVYAPTGHWLVFYENAKGATYTAPGFYLDGENTVQPVTATPDNMHRNGYTFNGWYKLKDGEELTDADKDEDGNYIIGDKFEAFTFGSPLEPDVTNIYAKWTPNVQAPYTIVFWTENIDSIHSAQADKNYDLTASYTGTGTVGQNIPYTFVNNGDEDYIRAGGNDYHYTGFSLIPDSVNKQVTITPEGDAVLNLYYNRIQYDLRFYLYQRNGNGNNDYRFAQNSAAGNNIWGIVNWWGATNLNNMPTTTYPGGIHSESGVGENNITGYYILLSAYYGEDISDRWPTYDLIGNGRSGNTNYAPVSYVMMVGTKLKPNPSAGGDGTLKGVYNRMDENILGATNDADGNFLIVRFNTYNDWTYHCYYEAYDGQDLTGKTTRTLNGKTYYLDHDFKTRSSNTRPQDQNPPQYAGFAAHMQSASRPYYDQVYIDGVLDGSPQAYSVSGHDAQLNYYYDRLEYPIHYMDGVYVGGNDNTNILGSHPDNELHTSADIPYDAAIPEADKNYKPDPSLAHEPGFVFEGWYADAACRVPYNFTVMPNNPIVVYAKWVQTQYRVFLHPNAEDSSTNPDLNWGTEDQAMNFRISYGGKVSTPTGIWTRGRKEFIAWFTDEACETNIFDGDVFVLNDDTVTTDYDKDDSANYTDDMDQWGNGATYNKDTDRWWITKKLDIYAKWRTVLVGADGIDVVYVAQGTDSTDPETVVSGTVNGHDTYQDPLKYLDNAGAVAGQAAVPDDATNYQFLHWVLQKWDESEREFVDVTNEHGELVTVFPGDSFTVLEEYAKIVETVPDDPDTPDIIETRRTYTVQLRAEYAPNELAKPTYINWFKNDQDPSERLHEDKDLQINEATNIYTVVDGNPIPTRPGYKFLGWAREPEYDLDEHSHPIPETHHTSYLNLNESDLYLKYTGSGYQAKNKAGNWVNVTQVAADEATPYHAMYAVWAPVLFDLNIIKYETDTTTVLPNAVFTLSEIVAQGGTAADANAPYTLTTGADGKATVTVYKPANSYSLAETTPPSGYEAANDWTYTLTWAVTDTTRTVEGTTYYVATPTITYTGIDDTGAAVFGTLTADANGNYVFYNDQVWTDVIVVKVDDKGNQLPGAVFTLTRGRETYRYYEDAEHTRQVAEGNGNVDLTQNAQKTLYGLISGSYTLTENSSPDGYIIATGATSFDVSKSAVVLLDENGNAVEGTTEGNTTTYVSGNTTLTAVTTDGVTAYTFTISNEPGEALPNTGGPGTLIYTLSGIALMLGAALMYGFRMRRRERRLN